MKALFPVMLSAACAVGAQEPAPETSPYPAPPTPQQLQAMPAEQLEAARCAMKRVLLLSALYLTQDRHRTTPEHAAECLALARRLQAPAEYVQLLEVTAQGDLGGQAHYLHRSALRNVVAAYGVDAVAVRLLAETVHCTAQQARELDEWLPMRHVFNLVPDADLTSEDMNKQLSALRTLFERMSEQYAKVTDRASADAAAEALLDALQYVSQSSYIRLIVNKQRSTDFPGYARIVGEAAGQLRKHRVRLLEASFYGSFKLAALDELLCL